MPRPAGTAKFPLTIAAAVDADLFGVPGARAGKCTVRLPEVVSFPPLGVGAREHHARYLGTAPIAAHAWCE